MVAVSILKSWVKSLVRSVWRSVARIGLRLSGNRRGMVVSRKTFDAEWYLANHSDVAEFSGDPFDHFVLHGIYEGRVGRFFDAYFYRRANPGLRFSLADKWTHYRRIGKDEGLRARFFYVGDRSDVDGARSFEDWTATYDPPRATAWRNIQEVAGLLDLSQPVDVVLRIDPSDDLASVEASVSAIRDQAYPKLNCVIVAPDTLPDAMAKAVQHVIGKDKRFRVISIAHSLSEGAGFNTAARQLSSPALCFLTVRDRLDAAALFWVALGRRETPQAALFYADEDRVDEKGRRCDPYFKPKFNYELTLTHNMLGDFVVYQRPLFDRIGGFDDGFAGNSRYDLALRAFEAVGAAAICHIPRLLNHRFEPALPAAPDIDVVERHLARVGRPGKVTANPEVGGYTRVRFALPETKPLVSIVIPTRDRLDLLRVAVGSVLAKTTYTPFEIIIVDNGSVEKSTIDYFAALQDSRVRVLRDDRPFNFSALNNAAVRAAAGDYICMMNNDIEILTPDWLEEMMSFAVQPDVGCVGARLWYPDGTLQHGGVLLGFHGVAGHMHKFLPRGRAGYANRSALQQSLSAVTAAALLVKRSIYEAVGGLDESLAVAFNDVDFCLKVRDAGYRNIYTPFAEMNHYESASRGFENSPEKKAREKSEIDIIKVRYGDSLTRDPAYNPNLTLLREDLSLAFPPRVKSINDILIEARRAGRGANAVNADRSVR